jgi:hypothetical protein
MERLPDDDGDADPGDNQDEQEFGKYGAEKPA